MPTARWPDYADSVLAGICRLRSRPISSPVAGLRRLRRGRYVPIADSEEGLSIKEAAERLRIPRGTLYEDIKRIRRIFDQQGLGNYLKD